MNFSGSSSPLAEDDNRHEYLLFRLGEEDYGIEILKVQEIRNYDRVTRIANTPDFIRGVTNLRGVIVPIIDLRIKFALESTAIGDSTVVIVVNLANRVVGIVVDGVSDVLSLTTDQIRPAPEFSPTLSTEYMIGLGTLDDQMLILVDIERLLNSKDMALVEHLSETAGA